VLLQSFIYQLPILSHNIIFATISESINIPTRYCTKVDLDFWTEFILTSIVFLMILAEKRAWKPGGSSIQFYLFRRLPPQKQEVRAVILDFHEYKPIVEANFDLIGNREKILDLRNRIHIELKGWLRIIRFIE